MALDQVMPILPRRSPVINRCRDHNVRDIHARITEMGGSVLRGGKAERPGVKVSVDAQRRASGRCRMIGGTGQSGNHKLYTSVSFRMSGYLPHSTNQPTSNKCLNSCT